MEINSDYPEVGVPQNQHFELVWKLVFTKGLQGRELHLTEETESWRLEMIAGRAITAQEFDATL